MIIEDLDTRVAAAQLRLLFDIKAIFKRRGRRVATFENPDELLFDPTPYDAFEKYYPVFHSASFRRIVRVVANSGKGLTIEETKSECSDLADEQIKDVLDRAIQLQLLVLKDEKYFPSKTIGFGPTFEWYIAGVCIQELASVAY